MKKLLSILGICGLLVLASSFVAPPVFAEPPAGKGWKKHDYKGKKKFEPRRDHKRDDDRRDGDRHDKDRRDGDKPTEPRRDGDRHDGDRRDGMPRVGDGR